MFRVWIALDAQLPLAEVADAALRAIFACWQDDAPVDFEGRYYRFTVQNA